MEQVKVTIYVKNTTLNPVVFPEGMGTELVRLHQARHRWKRKHGIGNLTWIRLKSMERISDCEVISVFLTVFILISRHITINSFAAYDNDKDIDLDQQNNQSVIFGMEVGYTFWRWQ
jgi:hypothetical protein